MTWGELLRRVASRLNRDDLDAAIREIAEERVAYFALQVFYPGQVLDTSITTIPGIKWYDLPSGWQECNSVRLLLGITTGIWLTLTEKDYEFLNNMDNLEPPVRSIPTYWALYGSPYTPGQASRAIRFFPTPGAAYKIELTMAQLPNPPSDNASNFWTTEAANLILYSTAAEVCRVHVNNPIKKAEFAEAEARERLAIESKSIRVRSGGVQIRPYL